MYKVVDKVIHELEDNDEIIKFRLENLDGKKDKWCVEIYYDGQLTHHSRYDTEDEASKIVSKFIGE